MPKQFRPSTHESSILSKIKSSQDYARRKAISSIKDRDKAETLANAIAMQLIDNNIVETNSKNMLQEQIEKCLQQLSRAEDFDIDYQIAPFRQVVKQPHVLSLYLTAFVIEQLINHKSVVDIFGSDEDIYNCINKQIKNHLPS